MWQKKNMLWPYLKNWESLLNAKLNKSSPIAYLMYLLYSIIHTVMYRKRVFALRIQACPIKNGDASIVSDIQIACRSA